MIDKNYIINYNTIDDQTKVEGANAKMSKSETKILVVSICCLVIVALVVSLLPNNVLDILGRIFKVFLAVLAASLYFLALYCYCREAIQEDNADMDFINQFKTEGMKYAQKIRNKQNNPKARQE